MISSFFDDSLTFFLSFLQTPTSVRSGHEIGLGVSEEKRLGFDGPLWFMDVVALPPPELVGASSWLEGKARSGKS